jgi:hypothetical protein
MADREVDDWNQRERDVRCEQQCDQDRNVSRPGAHRRG